MVLVWCWCAGELGHSVWWRELNLSKVGLHTAAAVRRHTAAMERRGMQHGRTIEEVGALLGGQAVQFEDSQQIVELACRQPQTIRHSLASLILTCMPDVKQQHDVPLQQYQLIATLSTPHRWQWWHMA